MIPLTDMVSGGIYSVECLAYNFAVWDSTKSEFVGPTVLRNGSLSSLRLKHYDEGLPFGVVSPLERIGDTALVGNPSNPQTITLLKTFQEYILELTEPDPEIEEEDE